MDHLVKWFIFDLQLFADGDTGEKTEKATPRRRERPAKRARSLKAPI